MHELTICESLLRTVEAERKRRGFRRVHLIRLSIGRFSCLDPDALLYAFRIVSRDTCMEGAALRIERPPGVARCLDCLTDVTLDSRLGACPLCRGERLQPVGGDEMQFVEMEVA